MHRRERGWSGWSALLGLGILLFQVTAAAQAQTSAQACLQRARQFYSDFQYERALEELRGTQTHGLSKDERVSLLLFKGIFLAELLRIKESSAAFKEALILQPGALLPLDVSPKINLQFEAIRAALPLMRPGSPKAPKEAGLRAEPRLPPPESSAAAASPAPLPAGAAPAEAAAPQEQSPLRPKDPLPPFHREEPESAKDVAPSVQPLPAAALPQGTGGLGKSHPLARRILIPAGTGGALFIAGGVLWGLARKEYRSIESDDPRLSSLPALQASASQGRTYQTVGFTLMGAGLVGLGLAAGLYGTGRAESPVELSVTAGGGQAVFQGRWR